VGFADPVNWEGGGEYVNDFILGAGLGGSGCSNTNPECVSVYLDGFESNWATVMSLARAGAVNIRAENAQGAVLYIGLDERLGGIYVPEHTEYTHEELEGAWVPTTNDPNGPVIWDPEGTTIHTTINHFTGRFISLPQFGLDLLPRRRDCVKCCGSDFQLSSCFAS
jgi:hypothetical protein